MGQKNILRLILAAMILLTIVVLSSCVGRNLSPIYKEDLEMLPIIETPGGFQVSKQKEEFDATIVDDPILEFISCYNTSQDTLFPMETLKTYRFYLLARPWECTFHKKGCMGEFNRSQRGIWIQYYFADKGMTEHELAHMAELINKYDRFISEKAEKSRHCFKMTI